MKGSKYVNLASVHTLPEKTVVSLWKRIKCFPPTLRRNLKTQQSRSFWTLVWRKPSAGHLTFKFTVGQGDGRAPPRDKQGKNEQWKSKYKFICKNLNWTLIVSQVLFVKKTIKMNIWLNFLKANFLLSASIKEARMLFFITYFLTPLWWKVHDTVGTLFCSPRSFTMHGNVQFYLLVPQ